MEFTINYFIEVNLYLISLYFIYKGFIQQARNYKISRPLLLIGVALSLILPFINFQFLHVTASNTGFSAVLNEINVSATATKNDPAINWLFWIKTIYLTGVFIFLIKFLIQLGQLVKEKSQAIKKNGHFEVEKSTAAYSFMTWIFIGSEYSSEEKEILLRHEQVHVNKRHSLDILLCQAIQIIFWPNPLIYNFKKLFQENHEYQADELSWQERDIYIQLLVQQNFNHFPSITNQFKSSHLKLRIMRLKNQFKTKVTPVKIGLTVALFATTLFINQNLKAGSVAFETKKENPMGEDKTAEFPGGQKALIEFIQGNIIFPKTMAEKGLTGKVFMQFTVLDDGTLSDFKALRSPHEDFTAQALKMMKKMPKWIPGEKDGKKVKMQLTLPINFDIPKPPVPPAVPSAPSAPSK